MNPEYYIRYKQEIAVKALRIGTIAAIITLLVIPYFYYLDVSELQLKGTAYWRLLGMLGAVQFFAAYLFPDRPKVILFCHTTLISMQIFMMQGIAFDIFTNPIYDAQQSFAVTIGSMSVWLAAAMIASGARWPVASISIGVMAAMSIGFALYGVNNPGLIISVFMIAAMSVSTMINQERQERAKAVAVYDLEESERRIVRQREALKQANENLKGFNYAISHDLKAPVRRAYSYAQLHEQELKKMGYALEQDSHLDEIKKSLKQGYQAIEDLLMLSSIGQNAMRWEEINLDELVEEVWREYYKPEIINKSVCYEQEELGFISGDKKLVRHLFSNLISNAIKYTSKEPTPSIRIGTAQNNGMKTIFVKDNGAGFDNAFASKIGQPFKRFHSSSQFEGTGVGLAIVKQVVKLHDGAFWAEGEVGEGATFYCKFPVRNKPATVNSA